MLAKSSQSRNFFRSKIEFVFFAVNCVTRNSRYIVLLLSFKPRILPGWPYLPLLRTSEASHTSSRRVCSYQHSLLPSQLAKHLSMKTVLTTLTSSILVLSLMSVMQSQDAQAMVVLSIQSSCAVSPLMLSSSRARSIASSSPTPSSTARHSVHNGLLHRRRRLFSSCSGETSSQLLAEHPRGGGNEIDWDDDEEELSEDEVS